TRPDAAAPRRPLTEALAVPGGLLRRVAALRGAGSGGIARPDVLGNLGPRAGPDVGADPPATPGGARGGVDRDARPRGRAGRLRPRRRLAGANRGEPARRRGAGVPALGRR